MSATKDTPPAENVVNIHGGKVSTQAAPRPKRRRRSKFPGEKWHRERLRRFERRADCDIDIESLLAETKALAHLLSNMAESKSQFEPEDIAWIGSLLSGQLARMELALERDSFQKAKEQGAAP